VGTSHKIHGSEGRKHRILKQDLFSGKPQRKACPRLAKGVTVRWRIAAEQLVSFSHEGQEGKRVPSLAGKWRQLLHISMVQTQLFGMLIKCNSVTYENQNQMKTNHHNGYNYDV
jgi:hypothetical protein